MGMLKASLETGRGGAGSVGMVAATLACNLQSPQHDCDFLIPALTGIRFFLTSNDDLWTTARDGAFGEPTAFVLLSAVPNLSEDSEQKRGQETD